MSRDFAHCANTKCVLSHKCYRFHLHKTSTGTAPYVLAQPNKYGKCEYYIKNK